MRTLICFLLILAFGQSASQQPAIKSVPPLGIEISAADRSELESRLSALKLAIQKLNGNPLLPDVLIYHEAVRYALQYNEFFKAEEVAKAKVLLAHGQARAAQLLEGKSPWTSATGLVVRGYISKIDRSVQPYGLVIPPSFTPNAPHRWRLDTWFHGRNETLSETNFLADRESKPGEFTPRDTIVLHLYGRFCNANKFAGETDLFEALDRVRTQYAIDENRIVLRGFSMGGASAWHFGTHYAGLWAAIAPGAGFSESARFLKLDLTGEKSPPEWEKRLFHLYDATDYAANLFNTPVVAYNGEIDGQKQAADVMEQALGAEGMRLKRIVGPKTGHSYHVDSKIEIDRILDAIAQKGRDPYPGSIRFTTWTLAYNRMKWIVADALAKHWERARIDADLDADTGVKITTTNVTAFTIEMGPGGCTFSPTRRIDVSIDGQKLVAPPPLSDRSWTVHFRQSGQTWRVVETLVADGLRKTHGLQGPIDDAFLDSFVFVTPTGTPMVAEIVGWVKSESTRAVKEWRRQFRGDAQLRKDAEVTAEDITNSNLVLWGDPRSNRILAQIIDRLPVKWSDTTLIVGGKSYSAREHVPTLIFPNPLNPRRYVVLNSGFTFREFDYLNNARQTPKLPDYAVINISVRPDERYPGKVVQAGFFDDDWVLR